MSRPTWSPGVRTLACLTGAVLMLGGGPPSDAADAPGGGAPALSYPKARKADTSESYHDTRVADPYRWLEDPDSPETRAWVEAENKVTFAYLEGIAARAKLRARLTRLWDYEKF